jgi:hypothetical protein
VNEEAKTHWGVIAPREKKIVKLFACRNGVTQVKAGSV